MKTDFDALTLQPGYTTEKGKCLCGDSLFLIEQLDDKSINLVVTSPPFALQRKKEYGNEQQDSYVDWLCRFGEVIFRKLRDDGSLVIDLGGAYEKGHPAHSLYQIDVARFVNTKQTGPHHPNCFAISAKSLKLPQSDSSCLICF